MITLNMDTRNAPQYWWLNTCLWYSSRPFCEVYGHAKDEEHARQLEHDAVTHEENRQEGFAS